LGKKRKPKDFGFKHFEKDPYVPDNSHIRITLNMMRSKAWKELSVHSRVLYIEMKAKYTGNNEDNISFTYTEGEELMNKKTFTKSLDQLIELGFIKVVRQSWTTRECSIYGFHTMWHHYGTNKFEVAPRLKRSKKLNGGGENSPP
jgi:hypothetical protein